jgi:hypothetical protein
VEQWVQTERERERYIRANRSDIIVKNKNEVTCMLTDVTILEDGNVTQKEAENWTKYKSLCRDTTNVEHEMYDYTGDN